MGVGIGDRQVDAGQRGGIGVGAQPEPVGAEQQPFDKTTDRLRRHAHRQAECDIRLILGRSGQRRPRRPPGGLVALADSHQQQPGRNGTRSQLVADLTGPAGQPREGGQRGGGVGNVVGQRHGGRNRLGRRVVGAARSDGQGHGGEPVRLGGQTDGEHAEPYLLKKIAGRTPTKW